MLTLLICASLLAPQLFVNFTKKVSIIFPQNQIVDRDIYIDGIIEEQAKKNITVAIPYVVQEVMVQIGDYVKVNDVLATIDKGATQAAIFALADYSKLIPEEYIEVFNNIKISDSMLEGKIPDTLKATASGVITELALVNGVMTTPKSVIATIASTADIRLRMNISELECENIKEGDMVMFKASATGEQIYEGYVEKIFPTASKVISGTASKTVVPIYILPTGKSEKLKPGYSVTGVVKRQSQKDALLLPYDAIEQDEENIEYVYCYQDGKAVRKNIKTGEEFENAVEIIDGVTSEDAVISNPQVVKRGGEFVRLKNEEYKYD